jgi:nitrite reductase/ring-hydroxylating ferredoxin subunit
MVWTKVLAQDALPAGSRQVVKLDKQNLLLLNQDGTVYAVSNVCPHLKLPMAKGKITANGEIVCPWHRSAFKLCSGEVTTWTPFPPGVGKVLGMIASEKNLDVFPVRLEEGSIWVDIGA